MTPTLKPSADTEQRWRIGVVVVTLLVLTVVSISFVHKVRQGDGAFERWRPSVDAILQGQNMYGPEHLDEDGEPEFPTTPLVALLLYPLYQLGPVTGAIVLAVAKFAMAALSMWWAIRLAVGVPWRPPPARAIALVVLLTARPIISDIQHGNINLLVLFLIMAGLWVYAHNRPIAGGAILGVATVVKVTPGLFILYFLWKRQWRALIGCAAGIGIALALPALVLGFESNYQMHRAWFDAMILPFLSDSGTRWAFHINQSITGVVTRLLTDRGGVKIGDSEDYVRINLLSLDPRTVAWIIRVLLLATLAWTAYVCRTVTPTRRDWRLACEWAVVLIAMLLLSERTWKHHYVTMVLPIACVVMHLALRRTEPALRRGLIAALAAFFALTLLTSGELIGWIYRDVAHKFVEGFGSFFLAGLIVYAALSAILLRARAATAPDT